MNNFKRISQFFILLLLTGFIAACSSPSGQESNASSSTSGKSKKFKVAWSIYSGWQPWDYANQSKILEKWAKKYGIEIELIKMDYIPSVEAYVAGQVDACVMTNMEALDMPAASGVTSTALILGDYSNGNDALLTRDNLQVKDLVGKEVNLVELSVSHYILSRALEKNGLKESDVTIVNTSDSDIAPAFISNNSQKAVITWNPLIMEIKKQPDVKQVFASSSIPGEIMDLMIVKTNVLKDNPELGNALTGAWYEVMAIMKKEDKATEEALAIMAESAGCSLQEYKDQLKTTAMFYSPKSALNYTTSKAVIQSMDYVRKFCFSHGLLGENATSFDQIGIQYPNGEIQGDKNNIQLYFDSSFMEKAANAQL
ncbi:putative urea ABC transporter substrate-binding protein [Adhaeribacter aquaticus]|uniref:putative urea ABC transporter substrate-binding protein n=1 Tax=Adhaeribacter aquaticus TaxID=299567 RepID=UPI000419280B|nr:putative urea ABC transporter substrate-binding protein [Adhaeribacter aquaticus]